MFRKTLAAMVATLLFASTAQANYVTTNGDLNLPLSSAGGTGPFINALMLASSGNSQAYTNIIGPAAIGTIIHTVTIDTIESMVDGFESPVYAPDSAVGAERRVVAITALRGIITGFNPSTGGAFVTFTDAKAFITSQSHIADFAGGASAFDPSSMGAIAATTISTLSLAPTRAVLPSPNGSSPPTGNGITAFGAGGQVTYGANVVNESNPNATVGTQADTVIVLTDDGGDTLLENVDSFGGPFFEGLVVDADQTILTGVDAAAGVDAGDIAFLDSVFAAAAFTGAPAFSEGGYTPTGVTGEDFVATFSTQQFVITAVPEPSSMVLFGLGISVLCAGGVYRRRGQVKLEA